MGKFAEETLDWLDVGEIYGDTEIINQLIERSEDPERMRAMINASTHIGSWMDIVPSEVFENFDAYSKEIYGEEIEPGPFWEFWKNEWKNAWVQNSIGLKSWDLMQTRDEDERARITGEIDDLRSQFKIEPLKRQLPVRAVGHALNFLPQRIYGLGEEGLKFGLATGSLFAG